MSKRSSRGVTGGIGPPLRSEGRNGDLTIRKTRDGKIFYVKEGNLWHAVSTGIDVKKLKKEVDYLLRQQEFTSNSANKRKNIFGKFESITINKTGSTAAVDPKIKFSIGGTDKFVMGVDDSDSDKLKIDTAGTIGGATKLTMDSSGNVDLSASNLKLGTGATGVLLKNDAGTLKFRNVGDTADAIIEAKRIKLANVSGTSGASVGQIQYDSAQSAFVVHGQGMAVGPATTGSSGDIASLLLMSHTADSILRFFEGAAGKWTVGYDKSDSGKFKIDTSGTLPDDALFTLDTKGSVVMDVDTSGDSAEDKTGLYIDFDRTVAASGTNAHNDIGIDLDVNSRSLGTSSVKGMDIDVVGHTDGTHTAIGIDLDVDSADVNIGMQINTAGTHMKLVANADVNDYATFTVADTGDLTIATVGDGTRDSDFIIDADGSITLDSASGAYIAKNNNTQFSVANSAYAGMILGYTTVGIDASDDSYTLTSTMTVPDDALRVTFVAPPSGVVEIFAQIYFDASRRAPVLGLSDQNATDGYQAISFPSATDVTNEHIQAVPPTAVGDTILHPRWVVTGLTAGTAYEWWLGAKLSLGSGGALRWGGVATSKYPPFIMKATALPAAIANYAVYG